MTRLTKKYNDFNDYIEEEVYIKEKIWRITEAILNDEGRVEIKKGTTTDDEQLDLLYFCSDCGIDIEVERFGRTELIELSETSKKIQALK